MRDREIKVIAGYHEWNIFVDDEFLYSLGDITEDIDFFDSPENYAKDMIHYLYDEAKNRFYDNNDDSMLSLLNSLNENEKNQLKQRLENAYKYYMG